MNRRITRPVLGVLFAAILGGALLGEARVDVPPAVRETASAMPETASPAIPDTGEAALAADDEVAALLRLRAQPLPEAGDLFKPHSWKPKPAPVKAAPPPKPLAPALPYVYLGRMQDGDTEAVFLRRGDVPVIARANTVLDGMYRVEEISERRIGFTYLPLNQKQEILIQAPR